MGAGVVAGAAVASVAGLPFASGEASSSSSADLGSMRARLDSATSRVSVLQGQLSSANSRVATLQGSVTNLQAQTSTLSQLTAFQFFTQPEQIQVEAIAEAMIPTDSNGPGAKEAGVIYFMDGQLAGDYGHNANMYMSGPYVQPNQMRSVVVDGITYPEGTAPSRLVSGGSYQYPLKFQEVWRYGLQWTQDYCNTAYGANFEKLSAAQQAQVLTDLWNNKPTNFIGIAPQSFFSELHDLVWAGFFVDPLYGGNRGMVGWKLIGFSGTNQGDAYGEGYTTTKLMVMSQPVRLQPQSLSQYQQQAGELLPQEGST